MIPCEECLLIPVCRHKQFAILIRQCIKINEYLYPEQLANDEIRVSLPNLKDVYDCIKPSKWVAP